MVLTISHEHVRALRRHAIVLCLLNQSVHRLQLYAQGCIATVKRYSYAQVSSYTIYTRTSYNVIRCRVNTDHSVSGPVKI